MWVTAYFAEGGLPKLGLAPTVTITRISDGVVVVAAALMTAVGGGFYRYWFGTYAGVEYGIVADSVTLSGPERYAVGGTC